MGLTIHYSGKLRNPASLPSLIEEAMDICESMKWPYEVIDRTPDLPVGGILIAPEGSEPLWLTFHDEGFMCNPMLYEYVRKVEGIGIPGDAEQWLFTKTQYAGVDAHMAMIKLMRHLNQKYFEKFELHDESQFWETDDEAVCRARFGEYDRMIEMVGDALDTLEIDPSESTESVAEKIEKLLLERFGMKRSN
ncbi:MAG: hypothetical protein SH808_04500 [Saprospiraceae bacterium]|nr:hypothetical protein [Saprospiraceae bacterium]